LSDDANYSNLYVASNVADQSDVQNRDIRIKKILSRWITGKTAAIEIGQRYLERFALAPVEADFMLDAKDSNLKLCDFVTIESKQKQDFTGSPLELLLQITKRVEKQTGTTWAFVARQFAFSTQTFSNRTVDIDGSDTSLLFDLNLKAAHDKTYDPASLVSGSIVEFIIRSGVLISASTTSNYALTNPNTWPTGVFVRLIIESGAVVSGRGGFGADGIVFQNNDLNNPILATNGQDGGLGMLINYPIQIDNQGGFIKGGAGGSGAGGSVLALSLTNFVFVGGGAGSGGWPLGGAGIGAKAVNMTSDVWTIRNGNNGNSATSNINNIVTTVFGGLQGNGVALSNGMFLLAGDGGDTNSVFATGQNGDISQVLNPQAGVLYYVFAPSQGGQRGDAIHGNSFIDWQNTGTIYGAIT
jgi:hypothetical protein